MQDIFRYVDQNRDRFMAELFALVRQPSISAQNEGVAECAALLKWQMEAIGIPARILPTAGHPVVYGEVKRRGDADDSDLRPLRRAAARSAGALEVAALRADLSDGRIYGRGTGDNKGQFFAHLKAVEAVLKIAGKAPGQREVPLRGRGRDQQPQSPGVHRGEQDLAVGGLLPSAPTADASQPSAHHRLRSPRHPVRRGRAAGANRDVHSGNLGAYVPAPAWRLVHFLNTLQDERGRIRIKGFYDAVVAPPRGAGGAPQDPVRPAVLRGLGLPTSRTRGEPAFLERVMFQPGPEHLRPDQRLRRTAA